jgi:arylsulfatase A-like enzyme
MPRSNILVVVVDGLRASALGAYGNTTYPTPAFDGFAADSLLLDSCFAPAADLAAIYCAMWQSMHPARREASKVSTTDPGAARRSLPAVLAELGYHTTLITDEAQLLTTTVADDFLERIQLPDSSESQSPPTRAGDVAETSLAHLFAAASDAVGSANDSASQPRLVWVHSQGMYGPWDAPLELQQTLLDENDPPPIEQVATPNMELQSTDDPDVVFQCSSAYAAQIMVLDDCWQGLLDAVESAARKTPWLVMLVGARGFPLGEHRRIGGIDSRLYAEQLHVPWIIRCPDGRGRLARSGALTTHTDILPTLLDAIGDDAQNVQQPFDGLSALPLATGLPSEERDALLSATESDVLSIRTADWCLRGSVPCAEGGQTDELPSAVAELFVRPDDRWEANDISKLCPDVVEELREAATRALANLRDGDAIPRDLLAQPAEAIPQ